MDRAWPWCLAPGRYGCPAGGGWAGCRRPRPRPEHVNVTVYPVYRGTQSHSLAGGAGCGGTRWDVQACRCWWYGWRTPVRPAPPPGGDASERTGAEEAGANLICRGTSMRIAFLLLQEALRVGRYRKLNSIQREKHLTAFGGNERGRDRDRRGEVFESVVRAAGALQCRHNAKLAGWLPSRRSSSRSA